MRRANPASILTIAGHEYAVNVRRPGFIFFTLLIPALGALTLIIAGFFSGQAASFFASQFGGGGSSKPVGIVDQSGLFVPIKPPYDKTYTAFPDAATARQAIELRYERCPPSCGRGGSRPRGHRAEPSRVLHRRRAREGRARCGRSRGLGHHR